MIANQFTIVKKTYMNLITLSTGAVLNIILNLTLIPILGIEGASIATLIGYICSISICTLVLLKMHLIVVNKNLLLSAGTFMAYFLLWRFTFNKSDVISLIVAIIVEVIFLIMYKDFLKNGIKKIIKKKSN